MKFIRILSTIIALSSLCHAQQWEHFLANEEVRCQAIEGQYLWVGTTNYLAKLNTQTGETEEIFKNFGVWSNYISSIAIDKQGNKWLGVGSFGLEMFDGKNWTVYTTSDSKLPAPVINSIAVDLQGNIWIGTNGGLVKRRFIP